MFVTRAPVDCANASEFTVYDANELHDPSHDRLLTNVRADDDRVDGAMPTHPSPLLIRADTHPATGVPWLSQAFPGWPVSAAPVVSVPGARFRSGCVSSTPVSMITVMIELEPVVTSHACGAFMSQLLAWFIAHCDG